jgi:hypothetical protein
MAKSNLERGKREAEAEACDARHTQRQTALELKQHCEDAVAELQRQLSAERNAADAKETSLRAELKAAQAAGAALEEELEAAIAQAAEAERERVALEVQANRLDRELQSARAPFQPKMRDLPAAPSAGRTTGAKSKSNPAASSRAVLAHEQASRQRRFHASDDDSDDDTTDDDDEVVVLPPPQKAGRRASAVLQSQEYILPDNIVQPSEPPPRCLPSSPLISPLCLHPTPRNSSPLSNPLPPVQSRWLSTPRSA